MYVLILFVFVIQPPHNAPFQSSVITQEFESKHTCEAAGKAAEFKNRSKFKEIVFTCTEK